MSIIDSDTTGTDCTSESGKSKVHKYQHNWYELLSLTDLTGDMGSMLAAVKHTAPALLLPTLLATHNNVSSTLLPTLLATQNNVTPCYSV